MVTPTLPDLRSDAAAQRSAGPLSPPVRRRAAGWVRDNRLFSCVLLAAVTLRLLVEVAYPPALEFFGDSYAYLRTAQHLGHMDVWHPFGYPLALRVVSVTHSLAVLTVVQHALGVATGVLVYRLVRGYGAGPVAGTVAAAPVLLDAYQVDVEQFVLSDTLFLVLLVLALRGCLRLAHGGGTTSIMTGVAVGAALAAASLTRALGLAVALVALLFLVLARVRWSRVLWVGAAFAVPVLAYCLAFDSAYGSLQVQGYGGRYLYGTVAPFADCRGLPLPAEERQLCQRTPAYARPGVNQYVWEASPYQRLHGNEIERSRAAGAFAHAVVLHQPGAFTSAVLADVAHYFTVGRSVPLRGWFVGSWQFPLPDRAPSWHIDPANTGFDGAPVHGRIVVGLAHLLRGYQRVVYTPGPLLLLALLTVAGTAMLRKPARQTRQARQAAGLLAVVGVLMLVVPSATAGFDWRYLLPVQAVVAPAGALAVHVWRRRRTAAVTQRRLSVAVAGACVVATLPGLVAAPALASGRYRAGRAVPVPAAQAVGQRLTVRVGEPDVRTTGCVATPTGSGRVEALVAFPTTVRYRGGGPILVQPNDFALAGDGVVGGPTIPGSDPADVLPSAVLSSRYRQVSGTVYLYVPGRSGRLDYVDERGAGAAAWSFHVPERAHGRPLGARCRPRTSAGARAAAPPVTGLSPFTELERQRFGYAPADNGTLAAGYDVRWRAGSSQARFGDWQYPPSWQGTTATAQTLVGLAPGSTYCFSVRAHDITGAPTAWSKPRCTTRMYDDAALAATPGWKRYSGQNGFYYRTYTVTTTPGARLRVSGTYSRIGLVAYRCPTCGALDVYAGDTLVGSLDLRSPRARAGLVSWLSRPLRHRHGLVTLEVTSRGGMVVVDAFGLQR